MNTANVAIAAKQIAIVNTKQLPAANPEGFGNLLSAILNGQSQMSGLETTEKGQTGVENALPILEEMIQEILDGLPLDAGYLNPEMLQHPEVQMLLTLLPEEMQQNITATFETNQPIEALLEKDMDWENTLSLIIALQAVIPSNAENTLIQKQLHQHLPAVFTTGFGPNLPLKSWFEKLNSILTKINEQSLQAGEGPLSKLDAVSFLKKLAVQEEPRGQGQHRLEPILLKQGQKQPTGLMLHSELSQPLNKVQQFTIHVGEQQTKHAQAQEFMKQFEHLLRKGTFSNQSGMKQLTIKLFPEHLGRLDIRLTQMNGTITANISASSAVAKELIDSQVQQLRTAFIQQQLQVEKIEVTYQQQQYESSKDNRQPQQEQDERQKQERSDDETHSFKDVLEHATFNEEV